MLFSTRNMSKDLYYDHMVKEFNDSWEVRQKAFDEHFKQLKFSVSRLTPKNKNHGTNQ